ncbi:MAG: hypothetical protein ACE5LC_10050 [Candidatus Aminicenantales bacterium]
MDELEAKEEIRIIREMIEKTKKITAGSWMYLLVWGIVAILAVITMYILVYFEKYSWIWLDWIVFVLIGIVFTLFYSRRQNLSLYSKTYAHIASAHISIACGISFILVGFVFPGLKLYSWGLIPVFISLVAGILIFTMGGIFEWKLLKFCGLIWWAGSLAMVLIHENYRALLFIPLILMGYIFPALLLRSMYQKEKEKNAS